MAVPILNPFGRVPQVRERVLRANLGLGRFSNVTADGLCSPTPCWSYDYKGQLTAGNGGSYLYDGLGRRQQKTDAGGTVHSFVFDGGTPYTEFAPGFIRQTGGFYTYAQNTTYFNRVDHLGTPRLSTDYSGAVQRTEGVLMGPFGDNFTETSSTLDFTGLAGGFWDSENNGEHFGAREYQNTHGAWLTPDPAGLAAVNPGDPQTWNRYAYVGNNPTSFIDPSGLVDINPGLRPNPGPGLYAGFYTFGCGNLFDGGLPQTTFFDNGLQNNCDFRNPFSQMQGVLLAQQNDMLNGPGGGGLGFDMSGMGCGSDFLPCGPPPNIGRGLPCDFGVCNPIGNDRTDFLYQVEC